MSTEYGRTCYIKPLNIVHQIIDLTVKVIL
jgi:hypothetical protein